MLVDDDDDGIGEDDESSLYHTELFYTTECLLYSGKFKDRLSEQAKRWLMDLYVAVDRVLRGIQIPAAVSTPSRGRSSPARSANKSSTQTIPCGLGDAFVATKTLIRTLIELKRAANLHNEATAEQHLLPLDSRIVSLGDLKSKNEFVHSDLTAPGSQLILIGKLVNTSNARVNVGDLYVEQANSTTVACELVDSHLEMLGNIYLFKKWSFIPCREEDIPFPINCHQKKRKRADQGEEQGNTNDQRSGELNRKQEATSSSLHPTNFSYLEIDGSQCALLIKSSNTCGRSGSEGPKDRNYSRGDLLRWYSPYSLAQLNSNPLLRQARLVNIYGYISAISPHISQKKGADNNDADLFFFVEIRECPTEAQSGSLSATILFMGTSTLYLKNFLATSTCFVFTNLYSNIIFPGQPTEREVFVARENTLVLPMDDIRNGGSAQPLPSNENDATMQDESFVSAFTDHAMEDNASMLESSAYSTSNTNGNSSNKVISYQGEITGAKGSAIFILDDQFTLYLTHYPVRNFGRGLREGATIRIDNVHPVILYPNGQLHGFCCCMYSSIQILRFSTRYSRFVPLSFQQRELNQYAVNCKTLTIPDLAYYIEIFEACKQKFGNRLSDKNLLGYYKPGTKKTEMGFIRYLFEKNLHQIKSNSGSNSNGDDGKSSLRRLRRDLLNEFLLHSSTCSLCPLPSFLANMQPDVHTLLPKVVSIAELKETVRKFLSTRQTESHTSATSDNNTDGFQTTVISNRALERVIGRPIVLLGMLRQVNDCVTISDKTAGLHISMCMPDATLAEENSGIDVDFALEDIRNSIYRITSFSIVVESQRSRTDHDRQSEQMYLQVYSKDIECVLGMISPHSGNKQRESKPQYISDVSRLRALAFEVQHEQTTTLATKRQQPQQPRPNNSQQQREDAIIFISHKNPFKLELSADNQGHTAVFEAEATKCTFTGPASITMEPVTLAFCSKQSLAIYHMMRIARFYAIKNALTTRINREAGTAHSLVLYTLDDHARIQPAPRPLQRQRTDALMQVKAKHDAMHPIQNVGQLLTHKIAAKSGKSPETTATSKPPLLQQEEIVSFQGYITRKEIKDAIGSRGRKYPPTAASSSSSAVASGKAICFTIRDINGPHSIQMYFPLERRHRALMMGCVPGAVVVFHRALKRTSKNMNLYCVATASTQTTILRFAPASEGGQDDDDGGDAGANTRARSSRELDVPSTSNDISAEGYDNIEVSPISIYYSASVVVRTVCKLRCRVVALHNVSMEWRCCKCNQCIPPNKNHKSRIRRSHNNDNDNSSSNSSITNDNDNSGSSMMIEDAQDEEESAAANECPNKCQPRKHKLRCDALCTIDDGTAQAYLMINDENILWTLLCLRESQIAGLKAAAYKYGKLIYSKGLSSGGVSPMEGLPEELLSAVENTQVHRQVHIYCQLYIRNPRAATSYHSNQPANYDYLMDDNPFGDPSPTTTTTTTSTMYGNGNSGSTSSSVPPPPVLLLRSEERTVNIQGNFYKMRTLQKPYLRALRVENIANPRSIAYELLNKLQQQQKQQQPVTRL